MSSCVQIIGASLPAGEASNEYRNITVMTTLLPPQPLVGQYIGCCGQYRLLVSTDSDAVATGSQTSSADIELR